VSYVPKMRTQLVAARTVAEALASLVEGSTPAPETSVATIPEIAGPREEEPSRCGEAGRREKR
jgi:hypothetical protein